VEWPVTHSCVEALGKLKLACAQVGSPKLLIADESMAGLSDEEIDRFYLHSTVAVLR
jgi:ABC-type branched-subunit amino acid transport system ATPase component